MNVFKGISYKFETLVNPFERSLKILTLMNSFKGSLRTWSFNEFFQRTFDILELWAYLNRQMVGEYCLRSFFLPFFFICRNDFYSQSKSPRLSLSIHVVIAQPNMSYIICFGSYRPHGFVLGDASTLLSMTL
jgi:hypothetical protein